MVDKPHVSRSPRAGNSATDRTRFLSRFATLLIPAWLLSTSIAAEPPVTALAFAPHGNSLIACTQAGVHLYSWPDLKKQRTFTSGSSNLHDVAFSPDGKRLAVAGGTPSEQGLVEILRWPDGTPERVLDAHEDSVMAVAWRNTSILASASLDHHVHLWNCQTGERQLQLRGHSRGVLSLCFLPDDRTLVTTGLDQSLRVWDLADGTLVRSLSIHTQPVHHLSVRPDGNSVSYVASVSDDRTVRLWQPAIGRMVRFVRLPETPLAAAWLPDGSSIAAVGTDGRVRLIDPNTVEVTFDVPALEGWAYAVAVHPSDDSLVVGGSDGQLKRVELGVAE